MSNLLKTERTKNVTNTKWLLCLSFKTLFFLAFSTRKNKRKLGDVARDADKSGKFLMGNVTLTKLWNICPNNMEACASIERDFLPTVDEYFGEALEQLDPANQVEEHYK